MCGRFTIVNTKQVEKRFETSNQLTLNPSYNVAPGQHIPTITRKSPNKVTLMKWGIIWNPKTKYGVINIRSESTNKKPFFKQFLTDKRCLIVADSFYEWGEVKLEDRLEKYPFNFFLKDRKLFGFAGIYNDLKDAEGKPYLTCAILTTTPNSLVKKVHHRMPVIIEESDENDWLDPGNKDFDKLYKLFKPYPESKMDMYMVSKKVNSPKNDDPSLIEEFKSDKFSYGTLGTNL